MNLKIFPEKMSVCRLAPELGIPAWAQSNGFFSVTKTADELSIVCNEDLVPKEIKVESGWRVLKVDGQLDFALVGILNSLTKPLAEAGISIFALSTFDTDYLLVKDQYLEKACKALEDAGHFTYPMVT